MTFQLDPLPYSYSFLEPIISAETLRFHHDKHHRAYVTKLNGLVQGTQFEKASLEQIVLKADSPSQTALLNNAGQVWNHNFYWKSLTHRNSHQAPRVHLERAIERAFGTVDEFKREFERQSLSHFGSGWAWLVLDAKRELKVITTHDGDTPLRMNTTPIFTCDLWEHAYYIDYRNERGEYLANLWKILNWDFAESNYTEVL